MDGFSDSFIEFINGGAMSESFNKFVNFDEGFLDSNEGYKHKKEFSSGGGNETIPLFFRRVHNQERFRRVCMLVRKTVEFILRRGRKSLEALSMRRRWYQIWIQWFGRLLVREIQLTNPIHKCTCQFHRTHTPSDSHCVDYEKCD
jgi:hypothetical protein